jgi:DNA primase
MSSIDEIKARIDIVDLVSETVQLKRTGKNYTGFCPFHPNTRTPAFVVFPETGTWRCFGQCNEGGDIFGFVMKKEGWDFSEALHRLAEKAGVELRPLTPQEQAAVEENEALRELLEEAVTFYRHQLISTPAGEKALEYLRDKRGLSDETIEAFGLGYAPNSWEAASRYFLSKGRSDEEMLACGLASERESGGVYDRFRNRVMIPIRDERGRMAGFGARILDPDDVPKYLNSPQTELFDKSQLLYGLHLARKPIRSLDQAVIVEGYLDVIGLHQAGYENAVSPMGTALSQRQLALLKRFSRRIVLALDADTAGDKATLRGLQIARQTLDREADPVFDARGLLGYEARLQADIRVTTLPEEMDPDEVVLQDPQAWERILEQAKPIVTHVMDTLAASRDLDDPKVKDEIAAQVLPLIADVPSPIERDTYRQSLARLLRVDEKALLVDSTVFRRRRPRNMGRGPARATAPEEAPRVATGGGYALEAHALGVFLRRPYLLYKVDRALQEHGLAHLAPDDFQHGDHRQVLGLLQKSVNQDMAEPLNFVLDNLSLSMMEQADDMLQRTENLDPNEERVLGDLMRTLLDLRLRNIHQNIEHLHYLMQEAQENNDPRISQYSQSMVQHTLTRDHLDRARAHYTSRIAIRR